jgi:hypothetical protein
MVEVATDPRVPIPPNRALVVWRKFYIRQNRGKGKVLSKGVRSICEVLRELYRDAQHRDDALGMTKLEEAHDMAKRMQRKLQEYAGKSNDPVYLAKLDDDVLWLTKAEFKESERR